MRRVWLAAVGLVLLASAASEAEAQRNRCWRIRDGRVQRCDREVERRHRRAEPVELGVRGGYDFDAESGLFGAHLRVPVAGPVTFLPSFDVAVDDDAPSPWQANADVVVRPERLAGLYAGVGAAFVHLEDELADEDETEVGLNVVAGLDGGRIAETRLRPFVVGRWTRIDDDRDAFRLVAGISVAVSGR
jgi:opacity protein-like surface antigen